MGIDISMSMGWGVHFSQAEIEEWLGEDDEDGAHEGLNRLIFPGYLALTLDWAGDAWVGDDQGFVVYARDTYKDFDMGRSAVGGVYRASKARLSVEAQNQMDEVSRTIVGESRPIEWLVTVGVS